MTVSSRAPLALTALAVLGVAGLAGAQQPAAPPHFSAPLLLTPATGFGGYEPAVLGDGEGGVWVTAHKGNEGDASSPDPSAPYQLRGASWIWWSPDGRHFVEPPGMAVAAASDGSSLVPGDEAALASDDAGHVYAVDTNLADAEITRWTLPGPGKPPRFDFYRPVIPAGEAYDDRPWVAAHGNGVVLYLGNTWEQDAYPGDPTKGQHGASIVHMSYDGGRTFDPVGVPLDGSGWCRPVADHRPGSHTFYVICTASSSATRFVTDLSSDTLSSYVTHDDGRTWHRFTVGHYSKGAANASNWPSVAVAGDGTVYALYVDQVAGNDAYALWLYRSTTQGRTWLRRVLPLPPRRHAQTGVLPLASVAASRAGRVAVCVQDAVGVFATVGSWHGAGRYAEVPTGGATQYPSGDFTQCDFDRAGRLGVTWTSFHPLPGNIVSADTDVYFSLQR